MDTSEHTGRREPEHYEVDDDVVGPGAIISPDGHVGSPLGSTVTNPPRVEEPDADPDALVEGNETGDGTELEPS